MLKIIIGKSASGKDTYLRSLCKKGVIPIIPYTTRPMRDGEIEGKEYHFVTPEDFDILNETGKFAEVRSYNTLVKGKRDTWRYATPNISKNLLEKENYALVIDLSGAEKLKKIYGDLVEIIYLDVPEDIREERAKNRGGFDQTEWDRRAADDKKRYNKKALEKVGAIYLLPR